MNDRALVTQLTRERALELLSAAELASIRKVEAEAALDEGEEYLDLKRLDLGVVKAAGTQTSIGCILPRRCLHPSTWASIVAELSAKAEADTVRLRRPHTVAPPAAREP